VAQELSIVKSEPLSITKAEPLEPEPAQPVDNRPLLVRGIQSVADFGEGIAKGVKSTAIGAAELVNKGTSAVGLTQPIKPEVFSAARREFATPAGTAQTLGYGVEQVGEMFVPLGGAAKVAKAAPALGRVAAKAIGEGAEAAAKTAVQTGGDTTAATVAGGLTAGITGAAGKIAQAAPALRTSAEKRVAQALGATKERFKAIAAKRAPAILERGLKGSHQALLKDATAHAREAGKAVDQMIDVRGHTKINTQPVIDALEEAKNAFRVPRTLQVKQAMAAGLHTHPEAVLKGQTVTVPVVIDPRPIEQLSKLQTTIAELGPDVRADQLVAIRRAWDDVVARAGGFAHRAGPAFGVPLGEQSEAWAKKQATTAIRKVLGDGVPDLDKVNAEFAFWRDLKDVLTATTKRTQAQGAGLARIGTAIAGGGIGAAYGDTTPERIGQAVLGAALAPKVVQMLTSARWKFIDAHARNRLAQALASGNPESIADVVAKLTASGVSQAAR
jgi:hypothetical protein